jgi:hypothetical protein
MRTTLTLDDDVAAVLRRLQKSRDASLKGLINEALRRGLKDMSAKPKRRAPLRTRSVALGRVRLAAIDNVAEALAIAEGEAFRSSCSTPVCSSMLTSARSLPIKPPATGSIVN